jgi:polyphosphate kinase
MADLTNPPRLASGPDATSAGSEAEKEAAAQTARVVKPRKPKPVDLSAPDLYLNRELTWLRFNWRVLREVADETNPLLERLKFEAIVASNLDEFVMKRIGGLKQQVEAGIQELTVDGRSPQQQIEESYAAIRELDKERRLLFDHLLGLLKQGGVELCRYDDLSRSERDFLHEYYYHNIFPLVTPQAMDPAHRGFIQTGGMRSKQPPAPRSRQRSAPRDGRCWRPGRRHPYSKPPTRSEGSLRFAN